jgi:U3 small nucleolar RNA-associated protein 23
VITQCEIRKLYAQKSEPGIYEAIECAKAFERRRCGHHPDEYPEPLSTKECLRSVVDPKDSGNNKHRYVVASQSQEVRRMLRGVKAVPLIYIKRSVMILEPMADESAMVRAREERSKFRAEIKSTSALGKRSREEDDEAEKEAAAAESEKPKKKKRAPGPKGPNPLAVKKPKKKPQQQKDSKPQRDSEQTAEQEGGEPAKKKRRRSKGKSASEGEGGTEVKADSSEMAATGEEA